VSSRKTFERSFRAQVTLKADEVCSLKRHYLGCARELAGLFDKLAGNDAERFVHIKTPGMLKHCNKFREKGKPAYKERQVKYTVAYFRATHVISKAVYRFRNGAKRRGFIVAPHDALTTREGNRCEFRGQLGGPGRWVSDCAGTVWWEPRTTERAPLSAPASAPLSAPQNDRECTPECTLECTPRSLHREENTELADSTKDFPDKISHDFPILNLENLVKSTERAGLSGVSEYESSENSKANPTPAPMSVSRETDLTKPKSKTVREHFADEVTVHRITDGELDKDGTDKYELRANWKALLDCCAVVIAKNGSQRYLGRKTNGDLMAKAMGLLKQQRGEKVPREWYPVAKQLRESAGPSVLAPVEVSTAHVRLFNPEAILSESCFGFYDEQLRPFETRLVEHAKANGVPRTFREALPWFETFVAASALENDSAIGGVLTALRGRNTC
jgi:hypothetical protein